MDSGYWQILVEPEAHAHLAFLTPKGKKRWMVMPMGTLNSAPTFVSMMLTLRELWEGLARGHDIQHCRAKVIIDDVLLYGWDPLTLLKYFRSVLDVLKEHRAMVKLKKCKWFRNRCEFVGVDVKSDGNSPAESKFQAFRELGRPR